MGILADAIRVHMVPVVFTEANMSVQTKAGWFYYVGRKGMLPK